MSRPVHVGGRTAAAILVAASALVCGTGAELEVWAIGRLPAPAQSVPTVTVSPNPADITAQLDEADRLIRSGRHQDALPLYEQALAAAREQVREGEVAHALAGRAEVRLLQRQLTEGKADAREAVELAERLDDRAQLARATTMMARLEEASGHLVEAWSWGQRALDLHSALGDRRQEAWMAARAIDYVRDLDLVRQLSARAVAAATVAGEVGTQGRALHRLGDRLFAAELYEEALQVLESAKAAFERSGDEDDLGTVHNSIGRVYRAHGRLDEALRQQKRALELHHAVNTELARYFRMQSLNAVGSTYQRLAEYEQARAYTEQALALVPPDDPRRVRDVLQANMASILANLGRYQESATILEGAIARGAGVFASVRHVQLSYAYRHLGRLEDALRIADRAVELCGDSRETCANAYSARSEVQARLGNRAAALADQRTTMNLVQQLRSQLIPADFFRREFDRYYARGYATAIGLNLGEGDVRSALEVAEQGRARAFLDLLATRSLAPAASDTTTALPLTLRGDPNGRGDAGDQATGGELPVSAAPATIPDLVATARRLKSTLVTYWVGDDETFVWVVDASGRVQARRVTVTRTALATLIRRTAPFEERPAESGSRAVPSLVTRGANAVTLTDGGAAWRQLYTLLVAPVHDALPTTPGALVTIIPHDVLSSLSFAALQGPRGRYLLEDYTIHYAPAGALFQFTAQRVRTDARTGPMLFVSDPVTRRQSTLDAPLPRLPGARVEVASIERQLRRDQVETLEDLAATETRIRELVANRSVLHFATHAVVRDDDPFASFLALTPGSAETGADGMLTAADVYGLSLKADLVVLSACRSAAGAVRGDAIATFARAFLYAGTASLVASVWDVADEPTNRLVPAFYRAWLGGADKAVALRRAQLQLLADLRAGRVQVTTPLGPVPVPEHPVFWAGFALFGEPR